MFKKSIALISALSMLFSFTACGNKEETETTTAKGKDVAVTDVATDENGEKITGEDNKEENSTEKSDDKTTKKSDDKTTKESDDKTTEKSDDNTTKKNDKDKNNKETTTKKDSEPSTKKEIIDYYNNAVNKVKSDAESVVMMYDNSTNYKGIVEAGGLSKIGKLLMDTFLKENHERKTYTGTSEIVKAFPVETKESINIKESAIKEAKCEDKGDYYEITLTANCSDSNPDVNPSRGGGVVGQMFNILVIEDITSATDKAGAVLELEGIKFSYMGGTITAKIDKETGNMTYLYTKLPMVLSMDKARALAIVVKDAKIGLQFENKWEINW